MSYNEVVLLLGSNLGDKKNNLEKALEALQSKGCIVEKKTKILDNFPVEFHSSNNFCNIAALIRTESSPIQLLRLVKEIERNMGRVFDSGVFGEYTDRVIDIDIVTFNNVSFKSTKLVIPHHKNLNEREFSKKLLEELVNNENK